MAQVLRQSTQVIVVIGPFVDVADGFTPETGVTLSGADEAEILKANTATTTSIAAATWAAVTGCDGWYALTLTTSLTDTVGALTVMVNDDSVCLPVFARFQVIEEAAFDALYAASAPGPATPTNITAGTITTVTNLTNLPSIPANWLTATGIASNAITAAKIATDAFTAAKFAADVTTELQSGLAMASALATAQADLDILTGADGAVIASGTQTFNMTGSITGNLSGSVGSVSGAVGSVTGAVGSVTGNVGGNVVGSVASVTGEINTAAGVITTLDGLDTAQDSQHSTTQGKVDTAQADLDILTGTDGATLATSQPNYAPATAANVATALSNYDGPTNTEMVAAFTEIKGATWATTDTLEAIRDRGDSAWITATGFATHSAADVWSVATRVLTANTNLNDPTAAAIADAVWTEAIADHSGAAGSTAEQLAAAGAAGDPWATALPGSYTSGQAGKIVGDNLNATVSSRMPTTHIAATAGKVDGVALVDTTTTNTDMRGTDSAATAANLATTDGKVDAIKAKTDSLTFSVAGKADANITHVNEIAVNGAGTAGNPWGP